MEEQKPQNISRLEIEDWYRFIRADSYILDDHPSLLFQQAANRLDTTAPAQAARRNENFETRQWIRHVNKSYSVPYCEMTLAGHDSPVLCCRYSPNGSQILTAHNHGYLKLFNAETGEAEVTLSKHLARVWSCDYSCSGMLIVSAQKTKR